MKPHPTDWHAVATTKLVNVLGENAGRRLMSEVLSSIGLESLQSAAELRSFAEALHHRGGFATALGGLLSLHATIHTV